MLRGGGELHKDGCAVEECAECGGQKIECQHEGGGLPRIPFLWFPRVCMKCGALNPRRFMVTDAEWQKYVPPSVRGLHLCRNCYRKIKRIQDAKDTYCG